jgi:predicted nucleic acid-binding protein
VRTALDTNVISALWSSEPAAAGVMAQLEQAYAQGGLVISAPVYAELMAHPSATPRFVDDFLAQTGIAVDFDLGEPVWRQAAKSFAAYADRRRRSKGGLSKRLLVDFIVAAHALLRADRLMTLDSARYRSDFPKLQLV